MKRCSSASAKIRSNARWMSPIRETHDRAARGCPPTSRVAAQGGQPVEAKPGRTATRAASPTQPAPTSRKIYDEDPY